VAPATDARLVEVCSMLAATETVPAFISRAAAVTAVALSDRVWMPDVVWAAKVEKFSTEAVRVCTPSCMLRRSPLVLAIMEP